MKLLKIFNIQIKKKNKNGMNYLMKKNNFSLEQIIINLMKGGNKIFKNFKIYFNKK